jgi:hypothetical protein
MFQWEARAHTQPRHTAPENRHELAALHRFTDGDGRHGLTRSGAAE